MFNLALMADITLCHSIEMKSLFTRFRWKINSFLLSLKPPYENLQDSLADDNKLQPADNDTLISRWKTPLVLLILKPASIFCLGAFLTVRTTFEATPPLFFLKASANWNLLSLWGISSLRTWRWMTVTPSVEAPIAQWKAHRWVDWDVKGMIRCCRAFQF